MLRRYMKRRAQAPGARRTARGPAAAGPASARRKIADLVERECVRGGRSLSPGARSAPAEPPIDRSAVRVRDEASAA